MGLIGFILAASLLLATPGPTNTLLWLSGYAAGPARSFPLLAGEFGGYMTVIVPVAALASPIMAAWPLFVPAIKLAGAGWVLFLAWRLWHRSAQASGGTPISIRTVYVTTVLNPKAAIVALVIVPGTTAPLPLLLAVFSALTLAAGTAWIVAGGLVRRGLAPASRGRLMQRAAAAALVGFACLLTATSVAAFA